MLITKLLDRFKEIGDLAPGWDGDDAVPVNPAVLQLAQRALECLLRGSAPATDGVPLRGTSMLTQNAFPEPELGAVEDGRLDLSWGFAQQDSGSQNLFCTLDEEEVRIHPRNNTEKLRDLSLGNEKDHLHTLVEILSNELNKGHPVL